MAWSWGGAGAGAAAGAPGGIIGMGAGALLGGFFGGGSSSAIDSANSAREINEAQIALAREQMSFQERMSNTAHTREVADLRNAGLNPILSATGGQGASTPQGAMPLLNNPDKNLASDISLIRMANANTAKILSEAFLNKKQAELVSVNANNAKSGSIPLTNIPLSTAGSRFSGFMRRMYPGAPQAGKALNNLVRNVWSGKTANLFADE